MREVFENPRYVLLSILIFSCVLVFSIWLPNLSFVRHVATSDSFSTNQKLGILGASLGAFDTNFTPISKVFTLVVSFLFSVNTSVIIFYLRKRIRLQKELGTSFLGMVIGVLGIGCASCGSVILTSVVGLSTATAFMSYLPLKGVEFGILSTLMLSYSLFILLKKIRDPLVCKRIAEDGSGKLSETKPF